MKNLVQKCLERWNTAIEGKNASSNWQSFNYTVEHRHNPVWSGTCIANCIEEPKTKLAKTQKALASQQNTFSKVISQILSSVSQKGMGPNWELSWSIEICTIITLIIRTNQLFEHPPIPGKKINYCAFEHPRLKLLFQYPNIYTLRSSNRGRRTSTSLWQPLRSYSESYRTSSSILQVFSNVY